MASRKKKERIFLLVAILFTISVIGYESVQSMKVNTLRYDINAIYTANQKTNKEDDVMEYTFCKVDNEEKIWGTSKICDIYGLAEYEKQPLVYGQMLTLFGEPLYTTENLENQYSYVISATDQEGNVTYLSVYSGPSGPSIGGMEGDEEAAKALVSYILSAKAADYEYEGYYMDVPCKVKMGVKDGVPYTQEEMLNLTDEEFGELYDRLY